MDLPLGFVGAAAEAVDSHGSLMAQPISPVEVESVQKQWGAGFAELSRKCGAQDFATCKAEAEKFVSELYGYAEAQPVLFAPAEATEAPFRITSAGAVSFFVGGTAEDEGFAKRKSWKSVSFYNAGIQTVGTEATAMGTCNFTATSGEVTELQFTLGIFRDEDGEVKINLHHTSYPYDASKIDKEGYQGVTELEVKAAQKTWGDHVIEIGQYYQKGWAFRGRANQFVDTVYAYDITQVLFKPAEAESPAFRPTREGAVSYFVGGSSDFAEDSGFALRPWSSVTFSNEALVLEDQHALAAGTYHFRGADGSDYDAQYVFGYLRDKGGRLRVHLHHSTFFRGGLSRGGGDVAPTLGASGQITALSIEAAQRAWGQGLVDIATQYAVSGSWQARAAQFVDNLYAYSTRPVLFKPAEAAQRPFRRSREGAISYFVGHDPYFPEDRGFALKQWKAVSFSNAVVALQGEQAFAMGNMCLTGAGGIQKQVEYTMGYVRDEADPTALRLNVHHANFPFDAGRRRASQAGISRLEVEAVQHRWARGIVQMGLSYENRTLYAAEARDFVDSLYGFGMRPVVLRVTDTSEGHIRLTREGAVSYLIGRSSEFHDDLGIVTRPWRNVSFENSGGIAISGNRAEAMADCFFTDEAGNTLVQEHTMSFFRDGEDNLRIELHFISWPYRIYAAGGLALDWGSLMNEAKSIGGVSKSATKFAVQNAPRAFPWLLWSLVLGALLTFICGFALFAHRYNPGSVLKAASSFREAGASFAMPQDYARYSGGGYPRGYSQSTYAPVAAASAYPTYAQQVDYSGQYYG